MKETDTHLAPEQQPEQRPKRRLRDLISLRIQGKIILPYLFLTLVIILVGAYTVVRLVSGSLDERLNNQLLEAGRVVSYRLAHRELAHLEAARMVAYTEGVAEALSAGDRQRVAELAVPAAVGLNLESLLLVNRDGEPLLNMLQEGSQPLAPVDESFNTVGLWMVSDVLREDNPSALPKRGFVQHPLNSRLYYFTALPIVLDDQVVGAVAVGVSVETLLLEFKRTSLADVTLYGDGGRAIATSFAFAEGEDISSSSVLSRFALEPERYNRVLYSSEEVSFQNITARQGSRQGAYRLAYNPLYVSDDRLGVFSVALPLQFIISSGAASRNLYVVIFSLALAGVVFIGYLVAGRITRPISRLVRTSRAVAAGDLTQRTGLAGSDEIGVLAETFDEMTARLSHRTHALEEAAGRMQAILHSIGDGVLLEDLEGNFVPLNPTAEALLQEMSNDFVRGALREVRRDADSPVAAQSDMWFLERRRFEVGRKVISINSALVQTDSGENLGKVIVLRDVTAEVEAERLKDAFVAHVSHELRTPLTVIKGYGRLLLVSGTSFSPEQRNFLETINRQTDNLVMMVNGLLDFSEMEAGGRLGLLRRSAQLSALVQEVAAEWRPAMDEKKMTFTVEAPADLPPVDVDSGRLRWAIINLVRNAWQYTPEGGAVTLRLSANDDRLVLDVVDSGVGISAASQSHLFERFYRGEDGSVRGLGLGLYVTKAIVAAHGGEVRFISQEGRGSTFSIALPTTPASEGA